jgi:hypothetical protein
VSCRVVMRLTKWSQNIHTVREFLEQAEKLGAGPRAKMVYAVDSDGHPCLYVDLPAGAAEALEKSQRPKEPTKAQKAVTEQLETRRKAVKAGEKVPGHVPPAVKARKVKLKVKS